MLRIKAVALLNYTTYAVRVQTGHLLPITAYFPCSSMVLRFSFSRTFGSRSQMFVKKNVPFRPAGGESGRLSRQTPGLELTA